MAGACAAARAALSAVADAAPELARLAERATALGATAAGFGKPTAPGFVRWIDLSLHQTRLAEAPLDIREALRAEVEGASRAWIFTSATLGDDEELTRFTRSAGVEDARTLRAGSPFDYPKQAMLYAPQSKPDPNAPDYPQAVARVAFPLIRAAQGRTFVLCTSLRAVSTICNHRILLTHGDQFMTLDKKCIWYRAIGQHNFIKSNFPKLPFWLRDYFAKFLRTRSKKQNSHKPRYIMDVNPVTVIEWLKFYQVPNLIHGHIHQMGVHDHLVGKRYVLGDWYKHGNYIKVDSEGIFLKSLEKPPGAQAHIVRTACPPKPWRRREG